MQGNHADVPKVTDIFFLNARFLENKCLFIKPSLIGEISQSSLKDID